MIKRLQDFLERLRRDQGRLMATVQVDFYPNKAARTSVDWHNQAEQERDTVSLAIFLYARILYELAELNETRVANELMAFLSQVADLVLTRAEPPNRPHLPLGGLTLQEEEPSEPPSPSYRVSFFQHQDGQCSMDFQGSLGKEGVYLPTMYVVFLQACINGLEEKDLWRLAQSLGRLHDYYKLRKDFWEGTALTAGPVFALGTEKLGPEMVEMET